MKHLRLLEEADSSNLTRRQQPEKLHFLNPVPIRLIHDRWIDKLHRAPRRGARRPQDRTGGGDRITTATAQTTQVYQLFIKATPERIWEAITTPEFTARYFHQGIGVTPDATPRRAPAAECGGTGAFEFERRRLSCTVALLYDPDLAAEEPSRLTWSIEPQARLLTVVHDRLEGAPKTAAGRLRAAGWAS